jgi:hypothetical protein
MRYFRFEIPQGTVYYPGWHGTMQKCPSGVTVLLYNDKEGFGIAMTEDIKPFPPEAKEITEKEHARILADTKEEEGVFFGKSLEDRESWLPDAEVKEEVTGDTVDEILAAPSVTQAAQFCPICHKFITNLPSNFFASKIVMTCLSGHKVVIRG